MKAQTTIAAMTIAAVSGPAWAGYVISQGPTAPTYTGMTLNFDEPGGPTGLVSPTEVDEHHRCGTVPGSNRIRWLQVPIGSDGHHRP